MNYWSGWRVEGREGLQFKVSLDGYDSETDSWVRESKEYRFGGKGTDGLVVEREAAWLLQAL
jgi:hypothetical protein